MGSVTVLKASAGSGKTFRLVYEYVRSVIENPMQYKHILAVTFTNKATEEMKSRIISEINLLATGKHTAYSNLLERDLALSPTLIQTKAQKARTKILHDYSHFAILTIDKFFQRIIRSFIKELGIDLNFNLELRTDTLLSSASDAIIDDIALKSDLRGWITEFVEEKIAENKAWDIKTELSRLGSEIFKESYKQTASASASKEELWKIVSRANTQSKTAKKSMQETSTRALTVIASHNLAVDDFAYGSNSFASYFIKVAAGDISAPTQRVKTALEDSSKWYTKTSPRKADIITITSHLMPLLELLYAQYNDNIRFITSTSLLRENFRNFALLSDLAQKITDICTTENIMPISETNSILHKLISGNDTPFIFEKAGNHYLQFMIDEFQDTSSMQWDNFVPLLKNATAQSETNPVLLVGDIKQSIYRWRGGDWQILANEITREFPNSNAETLSTNYRSLNNIIEFNNRIIEGCIESDNTLLNNELEALVGKEYISRQLYSQMLNTLKNAYQAHAQQPKETKNKQGYINITRYAKNPNEQSELLPPVIERIEQLQQRGYTPSDIAILVRYNHEGVKIANMLLDYKSRHPDSEYSYNVVTQEALTIGSAPIVKFIIACLSLATNSSDTIKRAIFNQWLGHAVDSKLTAQESEFMHKMRLQSLIEAFESIVMRYSLCENIDETAYLQALHQQVITFSSSTISDISLFLKWWTDNGAQQSINIPQSRSAITIISVHKAKGLEFPVVIIPFCNWDLAPSSKTILWADCHNSPFEALSRVPLKYKKAIGDSFFAKEYINELILTHVDNINIFYVAATRAEKELHIMIPANDKKTSGKISNLILDNIRTTTSCAIIGNMQGRCSATQESDSEIFEFGEVVRNNLIKKDKTTITTTFRSGESSTRVKLRLPSERYTEDGTPPELSPRSHGVMMHKVFENINYESDIDKVMNTMQQNGALTPQESLNLRATIEDAFKNPIIKSWFDSQWKVVRNENNIITPGNSQQQRPDRVLIDGTKAVVIDYKFGVHRNPQYTRQIVRYADLLSSMGYRNICGYIWYVSLNEVEQVITSEQ